MKGTFAALKIVWRPGDIRRLARLKLGRGPVLQFLGDSHLKPIKFAYKQGWMQDWRCAFRSVGGATAVGLRHPTSKTKALETYRGILLPWRANCIPVFQLGEVDCGFVIWHRAKKYGENIDSQLQESLRAYGGFIAEMKTAGYHRMIVTSAMMPTIGDGEFTGEVALLRKGIDATRRQRTDLTLRYNEQLKGIVDSLGCCFADFTPHLLDPQTDLIREAYRHFDPNDHHLHPESGGRLWVRLVNEALASQGIAPFKTFE
jgi:hypothetical protein